MITANWFDRLRMGPIQACLLSLVMVSTGRCASAAQREQRHDLTSQTFVCHAGYAFQECEQRIAELKAVLIQYPDSAPKHWKWVIVRSGDWQPIVQSLHLDRQSPAFTALEPRETFLEDALFLPQSRRSGELMRYFHSPFEQLLSLAVSHELGHAICHGGNEDTANRVAAQLRNGKRANCVESGKSPTPIEELYLYRQSSPFRRSP
jgi:hypothetical protein